MGRRLRPRIVYPTLQRGKNLSYWIGLPDAATEFSERFLEALPVYDVARDIPQDDAVQYLRQLLRGQRHAFTEFEMFNVATRATASETLNRDIRWGVS